MPSHRTRLRFPFQHVSAMLVALLIVPAVCNLSSQRAVAEGILDYVPEDALGFVKINDLRETSDKLQKLAIMVGTPAPSPLDFLKATTGLTDGFDDNGDVVLALIPGSHKNDLPEPMLLLPTSDYRKFAGVLNGDVSGAISNVTVSGEEVLMCKMGDYALLMNLEHRETLEIISGLEPEPVDLLDPWNDWLEKNQTTVVIMPEGKKWLVEQGTKLLDNQIAGGPGSTLANPALADQADQLKAAMKLYRTMLEIFGQEFEMGAFGLAIDDESNIVFGKRFILRDDYSPNSDESIIGPLTGYAEEPFVFAGGCAVPQKLIEEMMNFSMQMMRTSPEIWQLQDLPEEQWEEFEEYGRESIEELRFGSAIMLPGEAGDPLMSNFYVVYEVDDSEDLLELYQKYFKKWNEAIANSGSELNMHYEVEEKEIAGYKGLLMTMDLSDAAQAEDVPQVGIMFDSMFGEGGKFRMVYLAVSENLLLMGCADDEGLTQAVERLKQQESGLEKSELLAETDMLMPKDTAGRFYISPQGCAQWAQRMLDAFSAMGAAPALPQLSLPATPPVGVAIRFPEDQLSVDVVWPASITRALVEHFKTNQGGFPAPR